MKLATFQKTAGMKLASEMKPSHEFYEWISGNIISQFFRLTLHFKGSTAEQLNEVVICSNNFMWHTLPEFIANLNIMPSMWKLSKISPNFVSVICLAIF